MKPRSSPLWIPLAALAAIFAAGLVLAPARPWAQSWNQPVTGRGNPSSISALESATIASGTTISSTGATSLASVTVSQPASGCAWRAVANYSFSWGGGSNQQAVSSAVWDGTAQFAPASTGTSNGVTGGDASNTAAGVSDAYSTSTSSATLTLYAEATTTTNPATVAGVTFGTPISAAPVFSLQAYGVCMQ